MRTASVFTVTELTRQIKETLEASYSNLWVEGEISNMKTPSSGHSYFTLKDKNSQIRAVMFRYKNKSLKYTPEDGMKVVCKCRINVYEPRGEYQLLIESMTPRGIGDLQFAFEQLKKKLEKEGFFDSIKKKKIPFLPEKIAVITSPTGAAVKDIISIITRRFPKMEIMIIPVKVQGKEASLEIEDALTTANLHLKADVIILGRGGGSMEDLWPFNEERVARAIFNSNIPVISAVGHETDFTIADFVADLRAPTPSAAAELVVGEKKKLEKQIIQQTSQLRSLLLQILEKNRMQIKYGQSFLNNGIKKLSDLKLKIDELNIRLTHSINNRVSLKRSEVNSAERIVLSSPPSNTIRSKRQRLTLLTNNISGHFSSLKNNKSASLQTCMARLNSLSPLHTLERGFSITRLLPSLNTVKDSSILKQGDSVNIRFSKGSADCKVVETNLKPLTPGILDSSNPNIG
jgi:exodeoxyribonuclease VII large subunit